MDFLKNSKIVLGLTIVLGVVFPQFASILKPYVVPIVTIALGLALKDVCLHHIVKENVIRVAKITVMYYLFLPLLLLGSAFFLVNNTDFQTGMILLALSPPAFMVIPLSHIMHANEKEAVLAEMLCLVFAMLIIPFALPLFLEANISVMIIFQKITIIIGGALVLSHLLHFLEKRWMSFHIPGERQLINVFSGLKYYVIIGVNVPLIFEQCSEILMMVAIFVVFIFGIGTAMFFVLKRYQVPEEEDVVYVLFASLRNASIPIAIAFTLFPEVVTLPLAVNSLVAVPYIIWLEFIAEKYAYHIVEQREDVGQVQELKKLKVET